MDTDISKISSEVEVKANIFCYQKYSFFVQTCRSALYTTDSEKVYHFEGCLSKFRSEITENKEMVIWIAIAALLALVKKILPFKRGNQILFLGCNSTRHHGNVYDHWGLNISMLDKLLQS